MREGGRGNIYGDSAIAHEVLEALEEEGDLSWWHLNSIDGVVGGSVSSSVGGGLALGGSLGCLLCWHVVDLGLRRRRKSARKEVSDVW